MEFTTTIDSENEISKIQCSKVLELKGQTIQLSNVNTDTENLGEIDINGTHTVVINTTDSEGSSQLNSAGTVIISSGNDKDIEVNPSKHLKIAGAIKLLQTAPEHSNSTGETGQVVIKSGYMYYCYDTDLWCRTELTDTTW